MKLFRPVALLPPPRAPQSSSHKNSTVVYKPHLHTTAPMSRLFTDFMWFVKIAFEAGLIFSYIFFLLRIWRNAKISWNAEKSVGIAAKVELNYTLAFLKFRSLLCVLFQRNFHIFLPTFRGGACTTCAFPGDSPTVVKILRGATLIR